MQRGRLGRADLHHYSLGGANILCEVDMEKSVDKERWLY